MAFRFLTESFITDNTGTFLGPELYTAENLISTTDNNTSLDGITVRYSNVNYTDLATLIAAGHDPRSTNTPEGLTGYSGYFIGGGDDPDDNGDRWDIDLTNYCSDNKIYEISYWRKHSGTGGTWRFRLSDSADLGTGSAPESYENIDTILATDTDWKYMAHRFTMRSDAHSNTNENTTSCGMRETNAGQDGSVYVDNFSIREVIGQEADVVNFIATKNDTGGASGVQGNVKQIWTTSSRLSTNRNYTLVMVEQEH